MAHCFPLIDTSNETSNRNYFSVQRFGFGKSFARTFFPVIPSTIGLSSTSFDRLVPVRSLQSRDRNTCASATLEVQLTCGTCKKLPTTAVYVDTVAHVQSRRQEKPALRMENVVMCTARLAISRLKLDASLSIFPLHHCAVRSRSGCNVRRCHRERHLALRK